MESITIVRELFDQPTRQIILEMLEQSKRILPLIEDAEFNRTYAHNPPFLVRIHRALTAFASELFGEPLKPSYSLLSLYRDGGRCPLHVDRDQCYRTIDYLLEQEDPEPWPIHVGAPMSEDERIIHRDADKPQGQDQILGRIGAEQWDTALLHPNDAACYSGTHQWHYRSLPSRGSATLAFFHFVPEAFNGPLD